MPGSAKGGEQYLLGVGKVLSLQILQVCMTDRRQRGAVYPEKVVCLFLFMANHYEALGLGHRQFDGSLTAQDIKQAYRKALLEHHPDKAQTGDASRTVDSITVAYKTLSEPEAKVEYDRELRLQHARNKGDDKIFHTGLDIVDLDDLDYDEQTGEWWRGCRCGQDRGFVITEDELENESRYGELITGCKGCSLWLKVLFGIEDEEQDIKSTA